MAQQKLMDPAVILSSMPRDVSLILKQTGTNYNARLNKGLRFLDENRN